MTSRHHTPDSSQAVLDIVRAAMADGTSLEIMGHGSKKRLGRDVSADSVLDMSRLSGITLYEPEELVMTALAGTPLADIEAALAGRNQYLAFEPLDLGPVYGQAPGGGTLGGMVATGLSGPRRISHGAVRDHVLGIEAVTGFGELVKAGGRVVKNVTGYDLAKLVTGSFGTLSVLTSLTLKVMPAPEYERTLAVVGVEAADALALMRKALGGPFAISGAVFLPAWATEAWDHRPVTFFRLEGFKASVIPRFDALAEALEWDGVPLELDGEASADVWRTFRQLGPAVADDGDDLWRLSVPPTASVLLAERLAEALGGRYWLDWAGGLVWLLVPPLADGAEAKIRAETEAAGGTAMLIRGTSDSPLHPLDAGKLALTKRIRQGFDPNGLFTPGRMYEGL